MTLLKRIAAALALLTAALSAHGHAYARSVSVSYGIAKHYSPGLMNRVRVYRGLPWPAGVSGLASRVSCAGIGQVFSASINGHYERLLQVDCSQYRDAPRHLREGLIVEVDYDTARRDGMLRTGRGSAVVWR